MPLLRYTSVSRTAARALEEFSDAFRNALVLQAADLWAAQFGLVLITDALKTTFPIPLDAAGYKEFKGDIKYRSLYSRALSMKTKKWQDGVEELAEIVEAPDFIDWAGQPAKMAAEWLRLPNTLVAQMLEANPVLDFYRDPDTNTAGTRALFASDHPVNVLIGSETFDNDRETTIADIQNGSFFADVKEYARSIKGPNGKPMGLSASGGTIICNGTKEELFDDALKQDTVIRVISSDGKISPQAAPGTVVAAATQSNRHKGTMSYQVADELTSASDSKFYVVLAGNPECHPYVVMQGSSPEEIVCDKNDAKYKEHLKVSIAYVGDANVAAALPHRIVRYTITG